MQVVYVLVMVALSLVDEKKKKERKKKILNKIQETKIRAIRYFPAGIICGPIWGSFPVWGSFSAL